MFEAVSQWIIPIILALFTGGGLATLYQMRSARRKIESETRKHGADAAAVLSDTAVGLVEPLTREIERLSKRVQELENQVDTMSARLESADRTFRLHGIPWP